RRPRACGRQATSFGPCARACPRPPATAHSPRLQCGPRCTLIEKPLSMRRARSRPHPARPKTQLAAAAPTPRPSMESFESRPTIPLDRDAPVARGRWGWPALAVAACLLLDGLYPLLPGNGPLRLLWIDLAAVGCLAWALAGSRGPGDRD